MSTCWVSFPTEDLLSVIMCAVRAVSRAGNSIKCVVDCVQLKFNIQSKQRKRKQKKSVSIPDSQHKNLLVFKQAFLI